MAEEFVAQVAGLTGLGAYPRQGPFGQKAGSAMGLREGYLLAIGPTKLEGGKAAIGILVRFRTIEQAEMLRTAVTQNAELMSGSRGKLTKSGPSFLRWDWTYSFKKPKPEEVAKLAGELVTAVKPLAPAFDGKCESCHASSTPDILLLNSVPGYYCESCQEKIRMEKDTAATAYEQLPTNFPNGLLLGIAAALVGGLAWGTVAYLLHYIFLYGAILIGYLIAAAVIKGMGKVHIAGQVLTGVLTVASVLFGDAVFYTLTTMRALHVPFSGELFRAVLAHFWQLETQGSGPLSVLFALVGAGYALYRARKPKFKVVFEKLGARAA